MQTTLRKSMSGLRTITLCLFFYLPIVMGCVLGETHKEINGRIDMNKVNKITYRFIDASVPPQYHRSYTITVSQNRAHITVDSYGDVLAEKEFNISSDQFKELLNCFQKTKIRNCKLEKENGCTGGTGEKISLSDENKDMFSGRIYHCGGKNYGNLCGGISLFAEEIKRMVPDLDGLRK